MTFFYQMLDWYKFLIQLHGIGFLKSQFHVMAGSTGLVSGLEVMAQSRGLVCWSVRSSFSWAVS